MAGRKDKDERSGIDKVLTPIAGSAVVVAAAVQAVRARRDPTRAESAASATADADAEKRDDRPPGLRGKLERVPILGAGLRVQRRYGELKGNNLAAAVAFQTFVSLFPLLLVVVAVLGFVASGTDVDIAGKITSNLGLSGEGAEIVGNAIDAAQRNREATAPLGLVALLWSGLGLVNAFQFALNQVWQVEERGLKDKAIGVVWLAGAAVLFVGAAAVTTIINWLPGFAAPLGIAVGLSVNFGLWLWTFRVLPNRRLPWRALMPGALLGAVGMELLKVAGAVYVPRAIADSSALYGSIGVVFAVLGWLLFFSRLVVYATTLNVVLWERDRGTVQTTIEVPAGQGIQRSDDVTRGGRVERKDAAA